MKKTNMMLALVGVLLLVAGCQKKVDVAFTTPTVNVAAEGGEVTASLTSNGDWTVDSHPEWLTVSPMYGSGDTPLKLYVYANDGQEARSGEVEVSSKDNSAKLTVTQGFVETYLRVTPETYSTDRFGGSFEINVESNLEWTLTDIPDWITASVTEGSNDGQIALTIAPITFEVAEDRQATLFVDGGDLKAPVTVVQSHESLQIFEVTPSELELSYLGGTASLTVRSTLPWTATADADWITISPNSGDENSEMTVIIVENTEFASRKENIRFSYTYPGGTTGDANVLVRQEAAPDPHFLTVDPQELTFGKDGGTAEITIACDTGWETELLSEWASVSASSGTGNATLTLTVSQNVVTEPRTVDFWVLSGNLKRNVVISQEKGDELPTVALAPDTVFVSSSGAVKNLTISSNTSWMLQSNSSWIMLLSPTGSGNGTREFIVDSNLSSEPRYGQIVAVHDNQVMDMAVVAQEGKLYLLETDITEIAARPEGGEYTINVTSTMNWTVEKGANWLKYTPTSGTGNGQVVVIVDPLNSPRPREAVIHILAENGATVVVHISQGG